jgi:hypothetical protein
MTYIISQRILTAVMGNKGLPGLISGVGTHDPALSFTYRLVGAGAEDAFIEQLVRAALPSGYSGDTLEEIPRMIASAREKHAMKSDEGDEAEAQTQGNGRSTITHRAIEAVLAESTLFHDDRNRAYISTPTSTGGRLCYSLDSTSANLLIRESHHRAGEKPLSRNSLTEVIDTLKARAIFDGPKIKVCVRVARIGSEIFIDLGTPGGEMVRITPDGWSVVNLASVAFVRGEGFKPLPQPALGPTKPGLIEDFFAMLGIVGDNAVLLTGFLLNCLRGEGPFMFLLVEGQQGSGKTFLSEVLKWILDPNVVVRSRLPENEAELLLQAGECFLPVYDNASGMRTNLSDTLSTIASGGSVSRRKLFSNGETYVLSACGAFIINGIGDFVTKPDLLNRAIPVQMEQISKRRTEADLRHAVEAMLPAVLAALYASAAHALRWEDQRNMHPEVFQIRMIDSAKWITAAEPALGFETGTFARTLRSKMSETSNELVNNEPIVACLRTMVEDGPFLGTVMDVFGHCCGHHTNGLPQSPVSLSKLMKRLAPALEPTGLHVNFEEKTKVGRLVRIWMDGQDPSLAKGRRRPSY